MKKQVAMMLAFGGLTSAVGVAHAQSAVTLYGLIDDGITWVSNESGHSNVKMDSGIAHGNRWGMKGREDLGGGLAAVFTLEGGFNVNTGKANNGGAILGRQSYVGLDSPWGTVTMGDQYDMISDYACDYNVSFIASGYGIHQGDIDRMSCTRLPNAAKYTSPRIGGFRAGVMYSFSNTPGNFHTGSAWEIGGNYLNGPFHMGLAYASLPGYSIDPYNRLGTPVFFGQTVATVSNDVEKDLNSNFVLDTYKIFAIGASYQFGSVTVIGNYTNTKLGYKNMTSYMHVYEGGATYQLSPAWLLAAGYQHNTLMGHTWNQVSAGAQYSLSKRTTVYVSGDFVKASSGVNPVLGWDTTPSLSDTQAAVRLGITHRF
ncbi:porin [Paraburkholderia phenoliruptrix]|uniref:Outer membrane protein OmpU n=2 Tax=Paraburkholderia phenoliruptrix TaxID=252970 RepID=K0E1X9_9BURK|nr:porin [Paraburkholderia phenoliruptrix]AFT90493.1 outer membrane protein OmpU [Paraburkholderia phenoliruptrix BR3459a]CAB4051904.1 Outer membrane porin protein [Paraburkholderia phenoliruptrix]